MVAHCRRSLVVALAAFLGLAAHSSEPEWDVSPERLKDGADENWPIAVDLSGITVRRDVVFATPAGDPITLDLYEPEGRGTDPTPCVIAIHGGGWRVNTKEWFAPHAAYLARSGYVAATINYRKLPDHGVQQCVDDAKAAVRWARAHAADLRIDPQRVGVLGGSAGGHLAAVLAVTDDKQAKADAVVAYAAGDLGHPAAKSWREELGLTAEEASRLGAYPHVNATASPLLLVHGTNDEAVPLEISQGLHARYQQVGAKSKLLVLDGYHHVFYVTPRTFFEAMGYAREFFDDELKR